jgi:hypothetical protein
MSDIATVANRVIPITVELYTTDAVEFPLNPNVVKAADSKYIIQFTLTNKDLASPYAVAATDVSGSDRVEIVFTKEGGGRRVNLMSFLTDGINGAVDYTVEKNDFPSLGAWNVFVRVIYDDISVSYPSVPFLVE